MLHFFSVYFLAGFDQTYLFMANMNPKFWKFLNKIERKSNASRTQIEFLQSLGYF